MLTFITRRLLMLPLVMFALTLLIVALLQLLTPEQRASAYVTSDNQARHLERIIHDRGLDQPFPVQYGRWLSSALHGDLGFSKASNKPVLTTMLERFPATIQLTLVSAIPIILVGVWLGTLAALHRGRALDQTLRVLAVVGYSLPTFVLGIVLLVVFYGFLGWLPGSGDLDVMSTFATADPAFRRYTGMILFDALLNRQWAVAVDALRHLVLPAVTLIVVLSAGILKVMRAQMLEALGSDYVRTARAKGLSDRRVNLGHARRNALLPIITLGGFTFIDLLAGAIITETVFGYPGIGKWAADAASRFDVPGVIGFALLSAVVVVIFSTLTDLLYGVIDPRVRFD